MDKVEQYVKRLKEALPQYEVIHHFFIDELVDEILVISEYEGVTYGVYRKIEGANDLRAINIDSEVRRIEALLNHLDINWCLFKEVHSIVYISGEPDEDIGFAGYCSFTLVGHDG